LSEDPRPFPAPPPAAAPQRVILAVGLPGSGKSAYFARRGIIPLSSDWLRQILADDPTEQRFQDIIFIALRYLLRLRLKLGRPLSYVDATNLTAEERLPYIHIAENYGAEIEAVFFDVPLEVCLERNRARHRVVPEDAMQRLAGKLTPPRLEEGFSRITTVSGDGREVVEERQSVVTSQ
jgi:predicted kinase